MRIELKQVLCPQPKSKIKASDGKSEGKYKFFTSSPMQTRFIDEANYDKPSLIFGTGGNASVHFCDEPFSTSTDCLVMYGRNKIELESIYNYLKGNISLLEHGFKGAGLKHISKDYILAIEIELPSEVMQHEFLQKNRIVDEIIEAKRTQLLLSEDLVKSRFIEMFGDPVTNPLRWAMLPLEKCLTVLGGYAFKSEEFKTSGVPVLRIGNINTGAFTPTNMVYWSKDDCLTRYQVLPGDLVISLTGTVGKDDYGNVCILGDAYPMYYLNQRNAKLILDGELNKHYLSELLKFSQIKKKLTGISRGVRQANISNRDILNLVVPIPPIEIQVQFAAFIEQVDKSKFYIIQMQILLRLLIRAIQQKTTEVLL